MSNEQKVSNEQKMSRVVIGGNIGSGKTTFIRDLKEYVNDKKLNDQYDVLEENIEGWNSDGILKKFYMDKKRYAKDLQTRIIEDYLGRSYTKPITISERSPIDSVAVFGRELQKKGYLDVEYVNNWEKKLIATGEVPDIYVCLNTPPEVCLERIRSRKRDGEEGITIEFLRRLEDYNNWLLELLNMNNCYVVRCDISSVARFCKSARCEDSTCEVFLKFVREKLEETAVETCCEKLGECVVTVPTRREYVAEGGGEQI